MTFLCWNILVSFNSQPKQFVGCASSGGNELVMSDLAKKFLAKWEFEHIEVVARSVRDEQARRLALQCREDAAKAGISRQDL